MEKEERSRQTRVCLGSSGFQLRFTNFLFFFFFVVVVVVVVPFPSSPRMLDPNEDVLFSFCIGSSFGTDLFCTGLTGSLPLPTHPVGIFASPVGLEFKYHDFRQF